MSRLFAFIAVFAGPVIAFAGERLPSVDFGRPAVRRPAGMAILSDNRTLAVSNRNTGTLSLADLDSLTVTGEFAVAKSLLGIVSLPDNRLAAVDADNDAVLIIACDQQPRLAQRLNVPHSPVDVAASPDGLTLIVTSLWSHRVSIWTRTAPSAPFTQRQRLKLDFPPRKVILDPSSELAVVADGFAGDLAAVQLGTGNVIGRETLHGHNIRGMAFFDGRLLLSHQVLHASAATTADQIAGGAVLENVQREITLVRGSDGHVEFASRVGGEIGLPSNGAADPAGIAITAQGERFVALSGVDEVAVMNEFGSVRQRKDVGRRPTEVIYDPSRDRIYVLNEFSDSVSVMHVTKRRATREIRLGPVAERSHAQRGEELFFDARLSRFGWISCHSCHPDGHTSGQLSDTFGDGSFGAPKRVLSLLGGRDNNPWAWNGSQRTLHDQVLKSVDTTMHGGGISAREVNNLVAYLHTLEPPPPVDPPGDEADRALIARGRRVFNAQGCKRCHVPPLTYTSDAAYDVGLDDEKGLRKFNPPSLRGVSHRRGYFHDLRAQTLEAVLTEQGHQLNNALREDELTALLRFLRSL